MTHFHIQSFQLDLKMLRLFTNVPEFIESVPGHRLGLAVGPPITMNEGAAARQIGTVLQIHGDL
jgi:hypothetical protein